MGACTSRHEVLKNAGEAPLPAPAIEEVEVIKEEVITDKQEEASAPEVADGGEAKRQSLGNLFKESEEEKGLSENTSEQVKQEDVKPREDDDAVETEKEVVVVVTVEASEENKTGSAEAISDEKKPEEKLAADEAATKTTETSSEKAEEEKSDEEKTNEKSEAEEQKTTASDEKKPLFKLWF